MMPGVSCNCGTFDGAAHTADGTKQSPFHHDGDDQNEKREWRGTVMRQKNFANACNCQGSGGHENPKGDDDRSQRFRLAMTIRMSGIGGTRGKSQPVDRSSTAVENEVVIVTAGCAQLLVILIDIGTDASRPLIFLRSLIRPELIAAQISRC